MISPTVHSEVMVSWSRAGGFTPFQLLQGTFTRTQEVNERKIYRTFVQYAGRLRTFRNSSDWNSIWQTDCGFRFHGSRAAENYLISLQEQFRADAQGAAFPARPKSTRAACSMTSGPRVAPSAGRLLRSPGSSPEAGPRSRSVLATGLAWASFVYVVHCVYSAAPRQHRKGIPSVPALLVLAS